MIQSTFICRQRWKEKVAKDLKDLRTLLTWDVFKDWDRTSMPQTIADHELALGLKILYGEGPFDEARMFHERCVQITQRALDEDKLQSGFCAGAFPINRGHLLRARTYARAVLGEPLDHAALLQASSDVEAWVKVFPKSQWGDNDIERVRKLLSTKKSFKYHQGEHFLLTQLAKDPQPPPPMGDLIFLESFDRFFDTVRDPDFKPPVFLETDIVRLELGAIRYKYYDSPDATIDWKRVIDEVSR